jgi:hypothetical protein
MLTVDNAGTLTIPGPPAPPGANADIILLGTRTIKGRLDMNTSGADAFRQTVNRNLSGAAPIADDNGLPSWEVTLRCSSGDDFRVLRAAAGTPATLVAVLSMVGTGNPAGDLIITGNNATKNTGTVWLNPSDTRLKQDIEPYERGLADILKLDPVHYTLKACGSRTCGFEAEKVREVFPECVRTTMAKLDPTDEEETEVLSFDMHPVLVAMVNAIKELAGKK